MEFESTPRERIMKIYCIAMKWCFDFQLRHLGYLVLQNFEEQVTNIVILPSNYECWKLLFKKKK